MKYSSQKLRTFATATPRTANANRCFALGIVFRFRCRVPLVSYDVMGMTAFDSERPSILIPPNDAPHRPDFSEPPDSNAMPLSCRWVLRLGVHELVLAAPFATHSAPDQLSLDIA
ncbi:hypothetical protein [Mesorhizobium sp. Root102]|uniref:hypothetical protein n=1 Tax=Mesorhizobium sp. Root102 TaxID=1736422 RepID=UPI0012E33B77|nr:hypothetical protein [Mesorhizobium sp. Root102]